ncbi:carbohydrate-binding module family 18 protein, partial [Piromyces sp. E2]
MKFVNIIVSTVVLISSVAAAPAYYTEGKCGPGYGSCKSGYCCSKFGWCGSTSYYCGAGCQSEFGRCDGSNKSATPNVNDLPRKSRCGPGVGSCSPGDCCSEYGWCGVTTGHCGAGCQSEFGRCDGSSKPSTPNVNDLRAPSNNKDRKSRCGPGVGSCSPGDCCSEYGWCGVTTGHCGAGCQSEFGRCDGSSKPATPNVNDLRAPSNNKGRCGPKFGTCPAGECCSGKGYCGKTAVYCSANRGGQKEYKGQCCSAKGYCGVTSGFCSVWNGCQKDYGMCIEGRCGEKWGQCPEGECCSEKGWCGKTKSYCYPSLGCQEGYGLCAEGR